MTSHFGFEIFTIENHMTVAVDQFYIVYHVNGSLWDRTPYATYLHLNRLKRYIDTTNVPYHSFLKHIYIKTKIF